MPTFIIPEKLDTVVFKMDYISLNQKLIRKSYPLTIISKTMHKFELFQYLTAPYINMGYYIILIPPHRKDMTAIVTIVLKFRYTGITMAMYTSEEIVQDKLDKILGMIEVVNMYADDILVLRKDEFTKIS